MHDHLERMRRVLDGMFGPTTDHLYERAPRRKEHS
jgi:hypothetical protein